MKYDWIIILVRICGSRDGGPGDEDLFFFFLSPPSPCRWVGGTTYCCGDEEDFCPPLPPKKGQKFVKKRPQKHFGIFMWKLHVRNGGGAFHLPPLCWADYVVKRIPWFTSRVHILHMFRVFPDHVFFQLSNHIISETDRTKHMAAWSGQNIWLHGPTREKKSFKKQTWDAIPWGGKGFYQGHVSSVPTVKP